MPTDLLDGLPITALSPMSVDTTIFNNPNAFSPTDMTSVTGAFYSVTRPDRTKATWACSIFGAEFEQVQIQHFLQVGDLTIVGDYFIRPSVTGAFGALQGTPFYLRVVNP